MISENEQIAIVLKNNRVFNNLDSSQLLKILESCCVRHYDIGDTVLLQDDPSDEILIILDGYLQVKTGDKEISILAEGEVVGEMGVFTSEVRSASVYADSVVKAMVLSKDNISELIYNDPILGVELYKNVVHILCDRLRHNNLLLEFDVDEMMNNLDDLDI